MRLRDTIAASSDALADHLRLKDIRYPLMYASVLPSDGSYMRWVLTSEGVRSFQMRFTVLLLAQI